MDTNDFKGFSRHYNEYFKGVYNYVFYRSGRHRERAEDMTSEIFMKAFEKFDTFDHRKAFKSWIFRIARNHVIDYYRSKKPTPTAIEDVESQLGVFDRIMETLIHNEEIGRVVAVMDTLPENYQDILNMRYFNDLSNEEIAEVLEKEVGNVRVITHRALEALKNALEQDREDAAKKPEGRAFRGSERHEPVKRSPFQSVLYYVRSVGNFLFLRYLKFFLALI